MHAAIGGVIEEEIAADALADEAAVEIGENREDGVDLAAVDFVLKFFEGEHPFGRGHSDPFIASASWYRAGVRALSERIPAGQKRDQLLTIRLPDHLILNLYPAMDISWPVSMRMAMLGISANRT